VTKWGCTAAEKEMCLSHYDANGKFVAGDMKACCAAKAESVKEVRIETTNNDGKVKSIVTTKTDGKVDTQVYEGTQDEVNAKLDELRK
jgi:K(+)-stimulated pyrophosphate-energized sodium pump